MLERDCTEFVVVPVQHQDRILGVYNLFLDRPLTAMGEDMPVLLISVGRHLGLAIEKARLESEARRLAIMEERNIIGAELHDSLAQSLIGMRLQLKMLSEALARKDLGAAQYEAKGLRRAMTQANADLRDLLTNYRLKIDESGLAQTVATLVERFGRETGIAVFFQNECQAFALTPVQEIQVFYIIQEALTNIRKHSNARNVRIMLNNEDDLYTVLIEDDGLGMAGPDEPMPGEHAGLAIMRERTERLPGQIVIESEPGEGTRIVLIFNAPPPAGSSAVTAPTLKERGTEMRVLLIDDHALVRKGIEELLQSRGVQVVASVNSGEEGVRRARELSADIILLDVKMPGMTGIETLKQLRASGVRTPVVMLTMSREDADLRAALRAGAQGYLLKDIEPEELVPALEAALRGDNVVARDMVGTLARLVRGNAGPEPEARRPAAPFSELTPRELEILEHVADGLSNKMIARALEITDGTVKLHVKGILRKLGMRSRVEAAVTAVEHGLGKYRRKSGPPPAA